MVVGYSAIATIDNELTSNVMMNAACINFFCIVLAHLLSRHLVNLYAAGISDPVPHYSLFMFYFVAKYRPHLSHFWALWSISGLFCGQ